ncbi:MAG: thioredoxin family protein [Anaerolineae bacterium]|nr:thioredoxin family protein [Anaerolineae bacterium]RLC60217.1 MAG: hypothetical protein DRI80_11225 [Chloroflexota bacterium]
MTKPIVDGLERELTGRARVIRLDVASAIGRRAARDYGVRGIPTFLLSDGQGQIVYHQIGPVNRQRVREIVTELESKEGK